MSFLLFLASWNANSFLVLECSASFLLVLFYLFLCDSCFLVPLLELVVPAVEVDVEHHHRPRRQAAQQEPEQRK